MYFTTLEVYKNRKQLHFRKKTELTQRLADLSEISWHVRADEEEEGVLGEGWKSMPGLVIPIRMGKGDRTRNPPSSPKVHHPQPCSCAQVAFPPRHHLSLCLMAKNLLSLHRSSPQICFIVIFLTFKAVSAPFHPFLQMCHGPAHSIPNAG